MKCSKNNSNSKGSNGNPHRYYKNHKVQIEDYESIRYPNMDVKRMVIEKMLADKINDLYLIIDELEQRASVRA